MVDTLPDRNVFKSDSDVHITFEDQQKINTFAKYNAKFEEYKGEVKAKENELKRLDDAEDELELRDDTDGDIPFFIGDNFIYMNAEKAKESLKKMREKIETEMKTMKNSISQLRDNMDTLKTQLYAKFGNHINLEGEE